MSSNNLQNGNMWFKLFALGMVAGVAKHLFGPPPVQRPLNQYVEAAERLRPVTDKDNASDD